MVVRDDAVSILDLEESDPAVVAVVGGASDPSEATHQCLRIGAGAIRLAHITLDSDVVEKRFEAMTRHFDEQVGNVVDQIAGTAQSLLDEDTGSLPSVLDAHRQQLEEMLGSAFDPDSKKSVMAVFENLMAEAHRRHIENVSRLISVDGDDSPLLKMKRAIVHDVGERLSEVRTEVRELSEKIAINAAIAPVVEITAAKGFAYEDVVHAQVNRIAASHGDVAEQVGDHLGSAGNKKGDEVVTLNHEDTHGLEGRVVLEAKSRNLNMRKTLEELDDALTNRAALAAIAVFSRQDQAPTSVPFHYTDTKAIVVLDQEGLDDAALRLAYMWGRWVVRRQLAVGDGDGIDAARVSSLIEDARRALDRATAIKRSHTQAKKSIDQAASQVVSLLSEVEQALDALQDELAAGQAAA